MIEEKSRRKRDSKKSSMEESLSSVNIHSRKRKKSSLSSSNSNPVMGILTRSKSRIYFHQNRSGISRPDPVPKKPILDIEVGTFLNVNCSDASGVSSIKDLRMKRVFTPDVNSVPKEAEEEEEKNKEGKKLLKGSDAGSDASGVLVSDLNDAKVDELEKSGILKSEIEDERNDTANGLNFKDQAISGNGPLSRRKMALNRCCRRKVFKTSSSFSYRRLLPYLMDIVNDASSVSKIEIVDAGIPCRLQNLDAVNSEVRSISENSYAAKIEHVVPQFDDSKLSENHDLQKVHIKVKLIQPDLSYAENELGQTAEIVRPLEVEQKGHENDMNGVDASVEEACIQTTPPDPGIITKTEVGHGGEYIEVNKVHEENQTFMGLLIGSEKSNGDALKQSPNSKCSTNSMNRSVLNPYSRLRLFKNPRSLSYRRLLPFLMDISKNNSCASRKTQHPMPQVDLEEDIHPASFASAEQNYVNKIRTENSYEKQHTEDLTQNLLTSVVPLPPSDGSSPDTNNRLVSSMPSSSTNYSSNVEPSSVTSETIPDLRMLIDLQTQEMPQLQSSPTKIEPGLDWKESSSASKPSSIVDSDILTEQCTSEEPGPVGKQKMCLDMGLELFNSNAESIGKVNLKQSSFQIEALPLDAMVSPNRPFKGILKTNRQGCRGLCNCLNCASFRLHADRAFEFSQKQMHEAEEVASELMKELANLRILLEKSIIKNNDSSGIQLNPVLIKQACNKALEAENLAKGRLGELNYDLSVHCRIPALLQPKVSFANDIQEIAIPVLNPSSGTEKKG